MSTCEFTDFLTIKQFAQRIGASSQSVRYMVRKGNIRHQRKETPRKDILIPRKELKKFATHYTGKQQLRIK